MAGATGEEGVDSGIGIDKGSRPAYTLSLILVVSFFGTGFNRELYFS